MKISIATGSYNHRRFSKPWIATVDFSSNSKGDFKFGDWIGDGRNGSEGLLEIEASPGDIVATGQKDHRQPRNSAPEWHVVSGSGELERLDGKVEALKKSREIASAEEVAS